MFSYFVNQHPIACPSLSLLPTAILVPSSGCLWLLQAIIKGLFHGTSKNYGASRKCEIPESPMFSEGMQRETSFARELGGTPDTLDIMQFFRVGFLGRHQLWNMNKGRKLKKIFLRACVKPCRRQPGESETYAGITPPGWDKVRKETWDKQVWCISFEESAPSMGLKFLQHPLYIFPIFCLKWLGSFSHKYGLKGRTNQGRLTRIYWDTALGQSAC